MRPFQIRDSKSGHLLYGGAWCIKFKDPSGRWRRLVAGSTYKDAAAKLAEIETDIRRGVWRDPQEERRRASESPNMRTWKDVVDAFAKNYADRSPSSIRNFEKAVATLADASHGPALLPLSTPIRDLTRARLRAIRDNLAQRPGATSTHNLRLLYLAMIVKWATRHPTIPVDLDPSADLVRYRAQGSRGDNDTGRLKAREVLSVDEMARLVESARSHVDGWLAPAIAVACGTGLRRGELFGLQWRDVDFDERLIRVERQSNKRLPKSGTGRVVPVSAELIRELRSWRLASPYSGDSHPIFPSPDGGHRGQEYDWSGMVRRAVAVAGLSRQELKRWGDMLRHSYASAWIAAGGTADALALVLGHKGTRLIAGTYQHIGAADLRVALDRLGGLKPVPTTLTISESKAVGGSQLDGGENA